MVERNMDDLDVLLRSRAAPPPRSNLAERIIEASLRETQKRPLDISNISGMISRGIDAFTALFILPRPAYALAAVLLLGVIGGFFYQPPHQEADNSYLDAYFLYMDDVMSEEAWL